MSGHRTLRITGGPGALGDPPEVRAGFDAVAQDGLLADIVPLTYHGGLGCGLGRRTVGEVREEQGAAIGGDGLLAVEELDDPACGAVVAEQMAPASRSSAWAIRGMDGRCWRLLRPR